MKVVVPPLPDCSFIQSCLLLSILLIVCNFHVNGYAANIVCIEQQQEQTEVMETVV